MSATPLQKWNRKRLAAQAEAQRVDALLVAETEISLAQYDVLAASNGTRMSEVAEAAGLSPSGLTRCFDTLARLGYVERVRDPDDRRGVRAVRTPAGDVALAGAIVALSVIVG